VGRAVPLIKILEDALKFAPVTFSVKAPLPGAAPEGVRELSSGTGLFTVNVTTVEGRPPGFATVTIGVPATAIALAGMLACNSETLENVVAIGIPLKLTIELAEKLFPDKVNVNAGPPAVALAGESVPTTGWIFAGEMIRLTGFEVPPPPELLKGFVTVSVAVPALAIALDETAKLSCVVERKVVGWASPLKFTTELLTKLNPDRESVNPGPPATTLEGLRDERIGEALEAGAGGT